MRAIIISAPGKWELIDTPVPLPGMGELLLRVAASGICGTDLRVLSGDYAHAKLPIILGHEFSGYVEAIGHGVEGFNVGDLVSADPNMHCGTCRWCEERAYNLCESGSAVGINVPGAMAEYVVVKVDTAVALPEGTDPIAGALIEPLSCVLHALDRLGPTPPDTMLITGGGAIGLLALIEARARGFDVDVVEPIAGRREIAWRLGASGAAASATDVSKGQRYSVVIDASGVPAAISDGLALLETRGTFIQMGVAPSSAMIEYAPYGLYEKELRIIGSNSVADCFEVACERAADLGPQLRSLVSQTFALQDFGNAIAAMKDSNTIKVQVAF